MPPQPEFRVCTSCGREKPLTAQHFHRKGRDKEGNQKYDSMCVVCSRPAKAARVRATADPVKQKQYRRAMAELRDRHRVEFQEILDEIRNA